MKLLLLLTLTTVTIWACSDDERPKVISPPGTAGRGPIPGMGNDAGASGEGGSGGESGSGAQAGSGGEGGAAESAGAPRVNITSPEQLDSPSEGGVLVGDEVEVTCNVLPAVEPGAPNIDPSSVSLELFDADGDLIEEKAGAWGDGADAYTASFALGLVPSGSVSFRCSASTSSSPPLTGADTISTYVDNGPNVEILEPAPNSVHSLMGEVRFEFSVEPAPLSDEDPSADVSEVQLEVNGEVFEVERISDSPATYAATVDFTDPTRFPDPPMGEIPVVVRATNRREPEAATTTVNQVFVLDGDAPVIDITQPAAEAVIGGRRTLRFSVADQYSAVPPSSVLVRLNTDEYRFDPNRDWSRQGNIYTFSFDTARISGSKWQVTVNVQAEDEAGNVGLASKNFYLDNVAPIVDLDPGLVREFRRNGECSVAFDPLGDAANDGLLVESGSVTRVRALVWERTNEVGGSAVFRYSGTDSGSVALYFQPNPTQDFVTDENGDGTCDNIESEGLSFQRLKAVNQTGTASFQVFTPTPDPADGCKSPTSNNAPMPLCGRPIIDDITRVIDHPISGPSPVVYAIGQLEPGECTGGHWELTALTEGAEGWGCLAAEAWDFAGNHGVSAPLRVCIDNGADPPPDCSPATMPRCTDGCTATRFEGAVIPVDP